VSQFKYSGGAMLAIIGAAAVVVVLVLRWLGQNSAAIAAGVRTAGQVLIVALVAAGIGAAAWQVQKHRRAAAVPQDAPPPVQAVSERVPLRLVPPEPPPALPPGRSGDTHLHFHGLTGDQAATITRTAIERNDQP
jgi:hypothetical protein